MATIKQKKAVKALAENGGVVSRAMITAGYSPATAKTPQKLTERLGFQQLMDEHLSDELVTKRHQWLINHKEHTAVKSGVDMAYKLKGSYAPEKREVKTQNLNLNLDVKQEEVEAITSKANNELRELYSKKDA